MLEATRSHIHSCLSKLTETSVTNNLTKLNTLTHPQSKLSMPGSDALLIQYGTLTPIQGILFGFGYVEIPITSFSG